VYDIYGQKPIRQTYSDTKGHTYTFEVVVSWRGTRYGRDEYFAYAPKIKYYYEKGDEITLKAIFKSFKWIGNAPKNHSLVLKGSKTPKHTGLKPINKQDYTLHLGGSQTLSFKVTGLGSGTLSVPYEIKNKNGRPLKTFTAKKAYTIIKKGGTDTEMEKDDVREQTITFIKPNHEQNIPVRHNPSESDDTRPERDRNPSEDKPQDQRPVVGEESKPDDQEVEVVHFPFNTMEQNLWAIARQQNTPAALQSYLRKFPNGPHSGEAQKLLMRWDERHWQQAERASTIAAYQRYLSRYPNGIHSSHAHQAIRELGETMTEEDKYWIGVRLADSIPAYEVYLDQYPEGKHADEAKERIELLSPLQYHIQREGQKFVIDLDNVSPPIVASISPNEGVEIENHDSTIIVWVKDAHHHVLTLSDASSRLLELDLDATTQELAADIADKKDRITFKVSGGAPPYFVQFIKANQAFASHEYNMATQTQFELVKEDLPKKLSGSYVIRVLDSRRTEMIEMNGIQVSTSDWGLPMWLWGIPILLILGWLIYISNKENKPKYY